MAQLIITFESESSAQLGVDEATEVRTPLGKVVAGDLSPGDFVCLCSDGTHAAKIETIEEAS